MFRNRRLMVLFGLYLSINVGTARAQDSVDVKAAQTLHIDIPVKLEKANVVFDIGHAVYVGDMPFDLRDLNLLAGDYSDGTTKGQIIAVLPARR